MYCYQFLNYSTDTKKSHQSLSFILRSKKFRTVSPHVREQLYQCSVNPCKNKTFITAGVGPWRSGFLQILQHFCYSAYNLQPKIQKNLRLNSNLQISIIKRCHFYVLKMTYISILAILEDVTGCFIILKCIKYIDGAFIFQNAHTHLITDYYLQTCMADSHSTSYLSTTIA